MNKENCMFTSGQMKYLKKKQKIDKVISGISLVLLSPVLAGIAVAIKIDDPGPVLFKQQRIGLNKKLFNIYKFRTMKTITPKDTPTHLLKNPEQYITKIGKILRKTSLDELPQIINIWKGDMAFVGPRPALWNQDDLVLERDKYNANAIMPGLTGWAQINGRDELEIDVKAKLDGDYVKRMSLWFDLRCILGTVLSVLKSDGVREGGTGTKEPSSRIVDTPKDSLVEVDTEVKRILITGANSYIGESVEQWLTYYSTKYRVNTLDMIGENWRYHDFSQYDVVFHVAGIAHADVGNVTNEQKQLYYKVNSQLAIQTALKAKNAGVKQFILMSSMIVYGGLEHITSETKPRPNNFYGNSKLKGDIGVRKLADESFKVVVLRPPMIYGIGSKGNYPQLSKLSKKLIVFPKVKNQRSMLFIDNLCEFVKLMIDNQEEGVFFPQNSELVNTGEMVQLISNVSGNRIWNTRLLALPVLLAKGMPGKIGKLSNKAFGSSYYDLSMSNYKQNYRIATLKESIEKTEGK